MKNRQTGFTLVELMVTLVVAGILMAMAVPSYTRLVANSRIVDQTNELVGVVTIGRSEAIRRNGGITLCRTASASSTSCATADANWDNWILSTSGGVVLRRGTLNTFANTQHVSSSFTNESITFSPDGLARTGGALLNAADLDQHFFIVCSSRVTADNRRRLTLGASSRITTTKESGTCT